MLLYYYFTFLVIIINNKVMPLDKFLIALLLLSDFLILKIDTLLKIITNNTMTPEEEHVTI